MPYTNQPSRNRFAEMVRKALCQAGVVGRVRYDPEKFMLVIDEGGEYRKEFRLTNAYRDFCAARPSKRPEVLQSLIRSGSVVPSAISAEYGVPRLLPRLWHRATHAGDGL